MQDKILKMRQFLSKMRYLGFHEVIFGEYLGKYNVVKDIKI